MAKIGFIGMGNMGYAMMRGLLKVVDKADLIFADASADRVKKIYNETGVIFADSNAECCAKSQIVVLAVKPQFYPQVLKNIENIIKPNQILISIAPGYSIARLKAALSDQIRIVLPQELQDLEIDPYQDYVTLITCTPYGVNTHRLLVRGHRVDNDNTDATRITADAMRFEPVIVAPLVAAPILLVLLIILLVSTSKWNRQRKRHRSKNELKSVIEEMAATDTADTPDDPDKE